MYKEIEIKKMFLSSPDDDHFPVMEVEDEKGVRYTMVMLCGHAYDGDNCFPTFEETSKVGFGKEPTGKT